MTTAASAAQADRAEMGLAAAAARVMAMWGVTREETAAAKRRGGPQSSQSQPGAQSLPTAPGPPSWHTELLAYSGWYVLSSEAPLCMQSLKQTITVPGGIVCAIEPNVSHHGDMGPWTMGKATNVRAACRPPPPHPLTHPRTPGSHTEVTSTSTIYLASQHLAQVYVTTSPHIRPTRRVNPSPSTPSSPHLPW